MKFLGIMVNSIFLLVMLAVAGIFLLPVLPFNQGIELRIVESGSMEPAIMTGSLTIVRPADSYQAGEVIMFESRSSNVPTTHRVVESYVENGQTWFITKGDANEEADSAPVPLREVMGTVALSVPRVGFVLDFARQPIGFALLVVLPALLIILGEVEKIWRELRTRKGRVGYRVPSRERTPRERKPVSQSPLPNVKPTATDPTTRRLLMMDIATPARTFTLPTLDLRNLTPTRVILRPKPSWHLGNRPTAAVSIVVFSLVVFGSSFLGSTVSYFNDREVSFDNFLGAIALDVSAVPDGQIYNFIGSEIDDEDGAVVVFVAPENDSVDTKVNVETAVTSSSTVLCDAIEADATAPLPYFGPLPLLGGINVIFDAPWSIAFSLPDESTLSGGEVCSVEISLTAWHFDEELDEGYFDTEIVPLSFTYTDPAPAFAAFSAFSIESTPLPSLISATGTEATSTPPTTPANNSSEENSSNDTESGHIIIDEESETKEDKPATQSEEASSGSEEGSEVEENEEVEETEVEEPKEPKEEEAKEEIEVETDDGEG